MKKQIFGLVAGALLSTAAVAQDAYMGADFSFVSAELSAQAFGQRFSEDADPTALRVRGGIVLNENFAIEGVIGLGLQDDEIGDSNVDFGLDTLLGISAVAMIPLDRQFGLFGKIGFASVEYDSDDADYSVDDTGIMFGIGAKVNFDRNAAMTIEYTILPDVEDDNSSLEVESDMISIGAQFNF